MSQKVKFTMDPAFPLPQDYWQEGFVDIPGVNQPQLTLGLNTDKVDVELNTSGLAQDLTFSSLNYNTVEWSSGNVTNSNGTFSIVSGTTGAITVTTYIYIDTVISSNALQLTTTASVSVGGKRTLICVASPDVNNAKKATFQAFGSDEQSVMVTADQIVANTMTSNEINTGSINLSEWAGTLDNITDGTTNKSVTPNEKTGAGRGFNALNASNRYTEWLTNTELSSGTNPTNGVILDTTGLKGFKAGVKQFEVSNAGNAYFRGDIAASNITGTTLTGGAIQTSSGIAKRITITGADNRLSVYDNSNNNVLNIGFDSQGDGANNLIYARDINSGTGPIAFLEGWRDSNVLRVNGYTNSNYPTIYVDSNNNERTGISVITKNDVHSAIKLTSTLGDKCSIEMNGRTLTQDGNNIFWDGVQLN